MQRVLKKLFTQRSSMEEYFAYIKSASRRGVTTLDAQKRFNAHIYLENQPTIHVARSIYNGDGKGNKHPEVKYIETCLNLLVNKGKRLSKVSTVLTPIVENIKYAYHTVVSLITEKDALMIDGMKWTAKQALQKEGFTVTEKAQDIIQTLTLFQLHNTMGKDDAKFYTIKDVQQRIPLALTRMNMEEKIFLSLNDNLYLKNIVHTDALPSEWFEKLNLKT